MSRHNDITKNKIAVRRVAVDKLHKKLFFPSTRAPQPESTLAVLKYLAHLEELSEFQAFVIGSLLYAPSSIRDIDILLTGRPDSSRSPSVESIERALYACMVAGRSIAGVYVDPTYRPIGLEKHLAGSLLPNVLMTSIRLEDPGTTFRMAAGLAPGAREIGQVSVMHNTLARGCSFFLKLPVDPASLDARWLCSAIPVEQFVRHLEADGSWPEPVSFFA